MDWKNFTAKNVDDALTSAILQLETTADRVEYEVIEKETNGFLGMFGKPAKIKARIKFSIDQSAKEFLDKVFTAMKIAAITEVVYNADNSTLDINVKGEDMGVLIGKRGQTLDSLQYLVSLVVNKNSDNYLKVKLDTENYRERRKETLENLAKNIAYKVKRTKKSVSLEPMNPYERRIIHSALQNDKYVETYSEGEEPFRRVVINIKKSSYENKYSSNSTSSYNNSHSTSRTSSNSNTNNNHGNSYNSNSNANNSNSGTSNNSNTSSYNSGIKSKEYSKDYRKDYKEYRESKEKSKLEKAENAINAENVVNIDNVVNTENVISTENTEQI